MIKSDSAYLSEVLGINSWAIPHSTQAVGHSRASGVLVFSPFAMNESERDMAVRMLEAAQLNFLFFSATETLVDVLDQVRSQYGLAAIVYYGVSHIEVSKTEAAVFEGVDMQKIENIELPAISRFLDATDPGKLLTLKKSAWMKIKKLKEDLESQ